MVKPNATIITFQGAMTIHDAEATRLRLLAAMADSDRIEIDCSAVSEVDLTFIHILLAARQGAAHSGKTLRLAQPAAGALLDALERGGFVGNPGGAPNDRQFWAGERG